ncbi:MAG: MBL fold metallo-hydrolase [Planctomycetes bacterium]|nr:MBL fold metallo-hydrolase [Planctomycetota bacterium]
MPKLNVITLEVGPLATCCYLVYREGSKLCAIIDPGGDESAITAAITECQLTPAYILVTHSHFDHIAALGALKERYPEAAIVCSPQCNERMQSPQRNLSHLVGASARAPGADREITEPDSITVDGFTLACLAVPGHAPGHLAFYAREDNLVFCGDTLFQGSMGRYDLEECSYVQLVKSIKDKLLALPAETAVYPGHGPATTIADEKKHNPFIQNML